MLNQKQFLYVCQNDHSLIDLNLQFFETLLSMGDSSLLTEDNLIAHEKHKTNIFTYFIQKNIFGYGPAKFNADSVIKAINFLYLKNWPIDKNAGPILMSLLIMSKVNKEQAQEYGKVITCLNAFIPYSKELLFDGQ